jgi:hypothetical protein
VVQERLTSCGALDTKICANELANKKEEVGKD